MTYVPERGEHDFTELDVSNPLGGAAIQVVPLVATSASTSVGGAVNIDNSLNTGAGLVVFSSQAAPSGRLLVARSSSATFSQTVAFFQQAGTGHALHADLTQTNSLTASAINATSANTANSCIFVSGVETARATVKIAHTGDTAVANDANAAAISIDLKSSGAAGATAAQGIFIDSTTGGSTGDILDLRNNGSARLQLTSAGVLSVVKLSLTGAVTGVSAPAAGGAGALPATPLGYVTVSINGTNRQIPYYA